MAFAELEFVEVSEHIFEAVVAVAGFADAVGIEGTASENVFEFGAVGDFDFVEAPVNDPADLPAF